MLARSVILNVVGRVGGLAIGFAASVILARALGPSDRGLLAEMLAVSSLALIVAGIGIPLAVVYYSSRPHASPAALLGNSLAWTLGLVAVLVPLAWWLHDPIADAVGHGRGGEVWILAAALVPATFLDWTTHNQIIGALRFGLFNALAIAARVVYLVGIVVLVAVLGFGAGAAIVASILASLAMVIGSLPSILRAGRPRLDGRLMGAMLRYGARVQVGSLFQATNARFDVLILQGFRPLADVGYYIVAQTIAELVITLATAFQTSVLPLVARYEGDARQGVTSADSVRHYGILAAVATMVNAAFGTVVILFAFGPSFHPAVAPMLVLLPGIWFLGVGTVIQGDLGGRGRPGLSSALAGVAAVVTVALDFALIPRFGVMGAAVASVIAYFVYGFASLLALSRVSRVSLRDMVVPRRTDFAAYLRLVRSLPARVRRGREGA